MLTTLALSIGNGRAGAHLDVSKAAPGRTGPRLGLLAVLLVLPVALLIGVQAVGSITGWYSLDTLGAAWVDALTAASLCALIAVGLVVIARLRVSIARPGRRAWSALVTLDLGVLEALALTIGVVLIALFAVHLVADGLACANGVTRAC
jgi:hypothetical protein